MAQGGKSGGVRIRGADHAASRGFRLVAERLRESRHKELHGWPGFAQTLRRSLPQKRFESRVLLLAAELVFRKRFQKFHVRRRCEKQSRVPGARCRFKTAHEYTHGRGIGGASKGV